MVLNGCDDLTVSANYGTTGNDSGAGSYDFYGLFGSGKNYNGEGSIDITQASNDKLTWEKVSKLNIGLNFGLFNRVTVDANFYRNETIRYADGDSLLYDYRFHLRYG